jgi:hypothetical protein
MPTVIAKEARRAVISGHDRDGWLELLHARHDGVELRRALLTEADLVDGTVDD